ncbi:MAG: gliding motility-associated-like protein, partial [Limisphaerales bacterium]
SRFDKQGVVYQAVCAGCGSNDDFPTTPGVVSNINGSGNCNLGVAKFKLDFTGVFAGIGAPTIGCAPLEIDFINTSSAASFYIWDFGGGDLSTVFEPSRTYSDIGTYIVNLIAIDSNSCNIADTATIIITVHEDSVEALFDVLETDFCDSLRVDFTNNSSFVSSAGYIWNFGDGTFSFFESPSHTYTSPGTYTISLVVNDITSCNVWDTAYYEVTVLERAIAQFNAPPGGCVPYNLVFLNTSFGVDPSFFWDFGDGNISTTPIPVHTYNTSGTYTATLIIIDLLSCNLTDTFQVVIDVNPNPIAAFNALPEIGSIFQEFEFEDLSVSGIQSWDWDFGDGTTSAQQNPFHMYSEIGFFDVCLTVVNEFGCADSTCVRIAMDSTSQLLFPNAFSPNGDGQNDIFLPFNWGLENYHLQIFNRWGELVFETSLEDDGWDGTWKGKDQDQGMFKVVAAGDGLDGQRYRAVSDLFLIR